MDMERVGGGEAGTAVASPVNVFRRDRLGWTLCFRGRVAQVRDRRGVGYMAELLRQNERCIHVLELSPAPSQDATGVSEKARKAVLAAIRNALIEIESVHPELARHLRCSIITGATCCYRPEQHTEWVVSG